MKYLGTLFLFFMAQYLYAQTPELTVQLGHSDFVRQVAYRPDGKWIASASEDKTIKLWDVASKRLIRTLSAHTDFVNTVVFSPSGKFILSGSKDGRMILWKAEDGTIALEIPDGESVEAVAFTPDGKSILLASPNHIKLFSVAAKDFVWETVIEDKSHINSLTISSDAARVATAHSNGTFKIHNLSDGTLIKSINAHIGQTLDIKYSNTGKWLATAGTDKAIKLWTPDGEPLDDFKVHKAAVKSIAFSAGDKFLVSGSEDKTVKLWDLTTKTFNQSVEAHDFSVTTVTFSPDGKFICSGAEDNVVNIFETSTLRKVGALGLNRNFALSIAFNPEGTTFLVGSRSREFHAWDFSKGQVIKTFSGHAGSVTSLAYSKDGKNIVTASVDNTVRYWDINGTLLKTFEGHKGKVNEVSISQSGKYIISSADDNTLKFWEIETGKCVRTIAGDHDYLQHATFDAASTLVAVAAGENKFQGGIHEVKILDAGSGKTKFNLMGHRGMLNKLAFSPSGRFLATTSYDKTAKLWSTETGQLIRSFTGHEDAVYAVAFSPDGQTLVTGSFDKTIKVWDIQSNKLIKTLTGHVGWIWELQFSPDGAYLISSGSDTQIKIWNTQSWTETIEMAILNNGTDHVVINKDGYFDGTQEGINNALHFVLNNEIIPLSALYEKLHSPNLWARIMSGGELDEPTVKIDESLSLPAEVYFVSPKTEGETRGFKPVKEGIQSDVPTIKIVVEAYDNGGGIDEIKLFQNGKLVKTTGQGFKKEAKEGATAQVTFEVALLNGKNEFTVVALNQQRTESVPDFLNIFYGNPNQATANLYAIAIGINEYKNPKYNLNFAVADAKAFVEALKKGSQSIFSTVSVTEIYNKEATAANIKKAIADITAKAKPTDVFLFYYAGHGAMGGETGAEYFLCPTDVTQLYGDNQVLKDKAISAQQLKEACTAVKAQKQLILLDACQSGGATQAFSARGAAEEKAIIQLARSTGLALIAASGQEQFATEVEKLGHGVFTYSLLEALKGSADGGTKDKKITVGELRTYVSDRIPELSEQYKGTAQYPTSFVTGQDFPIVVVE
jgi:WD40 repeat protein